MCPERVSVIFFQDDCVWCFLVFDGKGEHIKLDSLSEIIRFRFASSRVLVLFLVWWPSYLFCFFFFFWRLSHSRLLFWRRSSHTTLLSFHHLFLCCFPWGRAPPQRQAVCLSPLSPLIPSTLPFTLQLPLYPLSFLPLSLYLLIPSPLSPYPLPRYISTLAISCTHPSSILFSPSPLYPFISLSVIGQDG